MQFNRTGIPLILIITAFLSTCALIQEDKPKNVLVLFGVEWDHHLDLRCSQTGMCKEKMIETFCNMTVKNISDSALSNYLDEDAYYLENYNIYEMTTFRWSETECQRSREANLINFGDPISRWIDNIDYRVLADPKQSLEIIKSYDKKIDYLVILFHGESDSMAEYNYYNDDPELGGIPCFMENSDIEDFILKHGNLSDNFSDNALIFNSSCKIAEGYEKENNTIAEMLSYACMRPVIASAAMVNLTAFDTEEQIAYGYYVTVTPDMVNNMQKVNTDIINNSTPSAELFRTLQSTGHYSEYEKSYRAALNNYSFNGVDCNVYLIARDRSLETDYRYATPFSEIEILGYKSSNNLHAFTIEDFGLDDDIEIRRDSTGTEVEPISRNQARQMILSITGQI